MARPQIASEQDILLAAGRVLDRDGVDAFTLSAVAREVGLTRAGIAFRYENARNLKMMSLDARCRYFETMLAGLDLARGGNGLLAFARFMGAMPKTKRGLLAYISTSNSEMDDPDMAALQLRRGAAIAQAIARAMPLDVPDHAGAVQMFAAHITGSLLNWASSDEPSGELFLDRRTRVWLAMTGIACDLPPLPGGEG